MASVIGVYAGFDSGSCRRQYSEALSGRNSHYFPREDGLRTLISWSCSVGDNFMKMFRILCAWFDTGYSSRVSHGGFWERFTNLQREDGLGSSWCSHVEIWGMYEPCVSGSPCSASWRRLTGRRLQVTFHILQLSLTADTVHASVIEA